MGGEFPDDEIADSAAAACDEDDFLAPVVFIRDAVVERPLVGPAVENPYGSEAEGDGDCGAGMADGGGS